MAMPLSGTRVSITLDSNLRYTSKLKNIDSETGTFITLQRVDFHGSEGRNTDSRTEVAGKRDIADYMRFQGCRVVKLEVIDEAEDQGLSSTYDVKEDSTVNAPSPASSADSSIDSPSRRAKDNNPTMLSRKEEDLIERERRLSVREEFVEQIQDYLRAKEAELLERTAAITAREKRLHHLPVKLWYMLGQPEEYEKACKEEEEDMGDWDECKEFVRKEVTQEEAFDEYEVLEHED